jgi:hypothetical protein
MNTPFLHWTVRKPGDATNDHLNHVQKYVFSSTLEDPQWDNTGPRASQPPRGRPPRHPLAGADHRSAVEGDLSLAVSRARTREELTHCLRVPPDASRATIVA